MAELGIHDEAVEIMKERLSDAGAILRERYKGVRLFRQPEVPEREQLYQYLSMTQEARLFAMESFPEQWPQHEMKMDKLRRKYA